MNRKEHLLTILAEECNEVAQRTSKALRFSLEEIQPGQNMTNADRILQELYDLLAMVEMCQDEGHIPRWGTDRVVFQMTAKKHKVENHLTISKDNGALTDSK